VETSAGCGFRTVQDLCGSLLGGFIKDEAKNIGAAFDSEQLTFKG
jgi:hypothetical protein